MSLYPLLAAILVLLDTQAGLVRADAVDDLTVRVDWLEKTLRGTTRSVYVRWGNSACPRGSGMLYSGMVGGGHYVHSGAGVNALCLPNDPVYDDLDKTRHNAEIYGAEYENQPRESHDKDVVCAVCITSGRSVNVMFPGKNECPTGWRLEYTGHLMAGYHGHASATEYLCMDSAEEYEPESSADHNGKTFYYVLSQCGSLNCPPYEQDKVLTCCVCSE